MMAGSGDDATKLGSILFTDLVGFTEYTDAVGDTTALSVLEQQTALAERTVDGDDARLVKELGDGLMLWFGSAVGGLEAASELLRSVERSRRDGTFPLAVRMGMHHGPAIARGDDLVGHAVNVAARVAALAGPGELLVSDAVVEACAGEIDRFPLQPIGPARVKGVSRPIWLHRLVG